VRVNETRPNVTCSTCGTLVEEPARVEDRQPCPRCGSLARTFLVTVSDWGKIESHESVRVKARHGEKGKPYRETFDGDDLHRDGHEWRLVHRLIDREHDRYTERIIDTAGNVVRDVDEPLSHHRGRGAAKRRPPTQPEP
jgi:DNA-directed RNA polymerase subunit RPC12/RpoP